MWNTLEDWYKELVAMASEKGKVLPKTQDELAKYYAMQYTVEDMYFMLFPSAPKVIPHTGADPEGQVIPAAHQASYFRGTEPKVTEQDIIARIAETAYSVSPSGRSILCEITMVNGFVHHGMSAPVSESVFDQEIGRKRALAKAIQAAWPFEAYLLKERLYNGQHVKD